MLTSELENGSSFVFVVVVFFFFSIIPLGSHITVQFVPSQSALSAWWVIGYTAAVGHPSEIMS